MDNANWFEEYVKCVEKEDITAAKACLLHNISEGMLIYRYCRGLNRDIVNLQMNQQWFSNVFSFNDPYDSAIIVDCGYKSHYAIEERAQAVEDYWRQHEADKHSAYLRNALFVCCLSETYNSFPMWGYYAAEHRGICIGYDLRELIEKYECMPVIYRDKLITYKEGDDKNMTLLTLSKSIEWKHEQEWRIVIQSEEDRGKDGIIQMDFPTPKRIFIGCCHVKSEEANSRIRSEKKELSQKDTEELFADLNSILVYAEKNHVEVHYPTLSHTEYKLEDRWIKNKGKS